jgi:uncharacterized protein (TIGR02246 family)
MKRAYRVELYDIYNPLFITNKTNTMKRMNFLKMIPVCLAISSLTIGCNSSDGDKTEKTASASEQMPAKTDLAKIKTEIQVLETSWANSDNARDTDALAAFYSDDAISMGSNKPMAMGKAAIRADIAASLAKRPKGATVTYDVMDVFGDENTVTEAGKFTVKDATGKVSSTGKYMAIWEKRDGKYICVRDIGNDDAKSN